MKSAAKIAWRWTPTAGSISRPRSTTQNAARVSAVLVRGSRRSARLPFAGDARRFLSGADGDRRKPVQPSGCPQPDPLRRHAARPDWLQFDCALSYGLCEYLRTLEVLKVHGWSPSRCIRMAVIRCRSTSQLASASAATRAILICFSLMGGFPDGVRVVDGHITMPDLPGIGFGGQGRSLQGDARVEFLMRGCTLQATAL